MSSIAKYLAIKTTHEYGKSSQKQQVPNSYRWDATQIRLVTQTSGTGHLYWALHVLMKQFLWCDLYEEAICGCESYEITSFQNSWEGINSTKIPMTEAKYERMGYLDEYNYKTRSDMCDYAADHEPESRKLRNIIQRWWPWWMLHSVHKSEVEVLYIYPNPTPLLRLLFNGTSDVPCLLHCPATRVISWWNCHLLGVWFIAWPGHRHLIWSNVLYLPNEKLFYLGNQYEQSRKNTSKWSHRIVKYVNANWTRNLRHGPGKYIKRVECTQVTPSGFSL